MTPGTPTRRPGVERDVELGDGGQAAVDVRIGADHLDLEARDAALADLVERARHAVHGADAVGEQRHAHGLVPRVARRRFSRPRNAAAGA